MLFLFLHYTLFVHCNKDIDLVDKVIIQNQFKLMEKSKVKQHGKKNWHDRKYIVMAIYPISVINIPKNILYHFRLQNKNCLVGLLPQVYQRSRHFLKCIYRSKLFYDTIYD